MAEKGILFNTEMVRAILEGRKTVTRRIVKPRYRDGEAGFRLVKNKTDGTRYVEYTDKDGVGAGKILKPPYQLGDTLYVRETFTIYQTVNYVHLYDGRAFSEVQDGRYAYKADGYENIEDLRDDIRLMSDCSLEAVEIWDNRWHPSVHMPKEAARIWLRVTDVRAERLQEMSNDDAIAEGIEPSCYQDEYGNILCATAPCSDFAALWDSTINEKDLPRYGWNANPWVWVIEFELERVE